MPPTPGKTYDLSLVICTVGSVVFGGFGESGAISIAPVGPIMTSSIGQDGQATYSRTNDKRAKVTVNFRQNSLAYQRLDALRVAQEAQPLPTALPFSLTDIHTGERMTSDQTLFMERPTMAFQSTIQDRTFVLELPNGFAPSNHNGASTLTA